MGATAPGRGRVDGYVSRRGLPPNLGWTDRGRGGEDGVVLGGDVGDLRQISVIALALRVLGPRLRCLFDG